MTSTHELAYQLWQARGRPVDSAEVDWYEAERRLALDNALRSATAVPDVDEEGAALEIETAEKAGLPGDSVVLPAESI